MTEEMVLKGIEAKQLTMGEGAELLRMSVRQLRRVRGRYRREGARGLRDLRRDVAQRRRINLATVQTICRLKVERYPDFSVRHFHEFATRDHGVQASYSTVLRVLEQQGAVTKAKRRGTYRRRRERKPMVGMRVHLDSSTHRWLGPELPACDLTVAVDDADGRILSARFSPQEGTVSTLQALWDIFTTTGRFQELYTDRGSHFCQISDAEVGPDALQATEVARVLQTLSIRHILAHSPQARGRSERVFGTIQSRLPQELRLHGIRDYAAAQRYLDAVFAPDFNERFTVVPACPESAYTALPPLDLQLLLSVHQQRLVRFDSTVQFETKTLQLPKTERTLYGQRVTVHRFLDGTLGVSHTGHLLACFEADGRPRTLPERVSPGVPPPTRMMPTPPAPRSRPRHSDFSDPNFWAFLRPQRNAGIVSRGDLFLESP